MDPINQNVVVPPNQLSLMANLAMQIRLVIGRIWLRYVATSLFLMAQIDKVTKATLAVFLGPPEETVAPQPLLLLPHPVAHPSHPAAPPVTEPIARPSTDERISKIVAAAEKHKRKKDLPGLLYNADGTKKEEETHDEEEVTPAIKPTPSSKPVAGKGASNTVAPKTKPKAITPADKPKKGAPLAALPADIQYVIVPANGNCLFNAVAVGLKKLYPNDLEIQTQLAWDVDVNTLKGDLDRKATLFVQPAATLREQAMSYLESHLTDENIQIALGPNLRDENEAMRQRVARAEETMEKLLTDKAIIESNSQACMDKITTLETEINTVKNDPQKKKQRDAASRQHAIQVRSLNALHKKQQAIEIRLPKLEAEIAAERAKIVPENQYSAYIHRCRGDRVYTGTAPVIALSQFYKVPIEVRYVYYEKDEKGQIKFDEKGNPILEGTFVETFNQSDSTKTPVKIVFINENHFNYVETPVTAVIPTPPPTTLPNPSIDTSSPSHPPQPQAVTSPPA